jgi:predicted nucleotidyltransferase
MDQSSPYCTILSRRATPRDARLSQAVLYIGSSPHAEVNTLLATLLARVQATLGEQFVAMFLDGSLASGDFDEASDIDFVVTTEAEVSTPLFERLRAMHDEIAALPMPWAVQLEGSYISREALRRYDPTNATHPNIERGRGERLKLAQHDATWLVHRAIAYDHGISLAGPPPRELIDPIAPDELRAAMRTMLPGWKDWLLDHPERLAPRGYQSYVVLTMCRVLYTLQWGRVVSKPTAARWARGTLGPRWEPLIERALEGRHIPDTAALPEDIAQTLVLLRYVLATGAAMSPG